MENKIKFFIYDGSVLPESTNTGYVCFKLEDDEILAEWKGSKFKITDALTINNIKNIIIKNQNDLFKFSNLQEEKQEEFQPSKLLIGSYEDRCYGGINEYSFSVCNRFRSESLKKFYNNLKEELFNEIENCIKNKKIIEIKDERKSE